MVTASPQQETTTSATTLVSVPLGSYLQRVDVLVDTSGSADLDIKVSDTGDFSGEETTVQTISYSSAVEQLEQFDFTYPYVGVELSANVNKLEIIARGDA